MTTDRSAILAALDGVGPLIRRLGQAHTQLWQERVGGETTGPQFTVLGLLCVHGAMDQGALGARAHLDKSTAADVVERLRQRGLVTVGRDPRDLRRKMIGATDQGCALATGLAGDVARIADQLLARLAPEERAAFIALARRLAAGDEEPEPWGPSAGPVRPKRAHVTTPGQRD
ncbi:MAG: MarR family winged helix-turn-helix transcriptional regulator [Segniliparus sp.]|uniref:MarR family winged helix-turn-helix transcriptional regulator n=1 Tax=Segniliparus sp. TaxID=2804064 RepID=UPI003F3F4FEC